MMKKTLAALLVAALIPLAGCDSKKTAEKESSTDKATAAAQEQNESSDEEQEPSAEKADEDEAAEPRSDQSFAGLSENENFYVEITPEPNPIPFQELFTLEIRVLDPSDKKTPVEGVSIDQVRATMPAHKHGMKVKPEAQKQDDGTFLVDGMKFHMQGPGEHGRWVIEAVLNDGETVEKVSYDVQCCAE
ncbi:MAG: hypothetical protein ACQEVA_23615 [Myxococcota bacterium]